MPVQVAAELKLGLHKITPASPASDKIAPPQKSGLLASGRSSAKTVSEKRLTHRIEVRESITIKAGLA